MNDTTIETKCGSCRYNKLMPSTDWCNICSDSMIYHLYEPIIDPTDTGERTDFGTGAVRQANDGRGRYDLISTEGLRRLALRYEMGANKYSDRNWEKGIPISNCVNSMIRHTVEYLMGMNDEDHLAAIAWNAFAIMHYERFHPELQDIPTRK